MIVLSSLRDHEALPGQANWHRSKVEDTLSNSTDNHLDSGIRTMRCMLIASTRTVSYLGILQQALRDLSAWVEDDAPPMATTQTEAVDGQIMVPPIATEHKVIQPVVTFSVNGGERVEVKVGEPVTFTTGVGVPPHTGSMVAAEWNFEGYGTFPIPGVSPLPA